MKKNTSNIVSISAVQENESSQFQSEFKVFVTDRQTNEIQQENRRLKFWFHQFVRNDTEELIRLLFKSDEFPRGKILFIKSNR